MNFHIFSSDHNIQPIEELFFRDGKIIPVPFSEVNKFPQEALSLFCVKHALYQLPTEELILFLKENIDPANSIEIGSGNGCIGRALGIKMTDNYMQTWPDIIATYAVMRQPVIQYGEDVEEINGNEAVRKYEPSTIVACWLTEKWYEGMNEGNMHGVDEYDLFRDGVKKYIHVGNEKTHGRKRILKDIKHKKYKFPWLVTRSMHREDNMIYIFEK
jgi:hypothetical protein